MPNSWIVSTHGLNKMKSTIAEKTYIKNVHVGLRFTGVIVLSVLEQNAVHIWAGILKQLVVAVEDYDHDFALAQHGQLVGLLHQAELALCERHLPIALVVYLGNWYFFASHLWSRLLCLWACACWMKASF